MSSWAQQLEAIRRAAQGGVRARTNAQRSQRLPLANNRLREVLLSRPSSQERGSSTTASWEVPSRQLDEEQPLIREGPTDHILLCSGTRALPAARQLPPHLATLTPLEGGSGERTALFCFLNREIAGMGEGPRPAARSWPATRRRRGASPKNAGCRRRRARPSRAA